jgi:hypothetical protein
MRPTRHLWSGFLVCGHCGTRMYVYYRPTKSGPVKTLRCNRKLGGCSRLVRGAEPIETFLEAAVFEIVRHPAFTQFLTRRNTVPAERGHLLEQARAVEALQQENLVAYAAPEAGERRRSKTEYELIAARLDRQLDLLNKKLRALSTPDLPEALTHGDLEKEWASLPFYARRRILETLIARVALLPVGRGCRRFHPSSVQMTGHSDSLSTDLRVN